MKSITIKTKIGWVTAFEENNKIFKIKFSKSNKRSNTKVLKSFKKNLLKYFQKKTNYIKANYKLVGNNTQKKIWNEMKKIKKGHTKSYGDFSISQDYDILLDIAENKGPAVARNVGAEASQGEILLFLDSDVIIKKDSLNLIIDKFEGKEINAIQGIYSHEPNYKYLATQFYQSYLCY